MFDEQMDNNLFIDAIHISLFLIGNYILLILLVTGLFNPWASTRFSLSDEPWSTDGKEIRFATHFPTFGAYKFDVDTGHIEHTTSDYRKARKYSGTFEYRYPMVLPPKILDNLKSDSIREAVQSPTTNNYLIIVANNHRDVFLDKEVENQTIYVVNHNAGIEYSISKSDVVRATKADTWGILTVGRLEKIFYIIVFINLFLLARARARIRRYWRRIVFVGPVLVSPCFCCYCYIVVTANLNGY